MWLRRGAVLLMLRSTIWLLLWGTVWLRRSAVLLGGWSTVGGGGGRSTAIGLGCIFVFVVVLEVDQSSFSFIWLKGTHAFVNTTKEELGVPMVFGQGETLSLPLTGFHLEVYSG